MSLTINGIDVASLRFLASWNGVWSAEVEIGASPTATVPTGAATIVSTEGDTLVGVVDDSRSATFGEKRFARVVGGAGWSKHVRAGHYHSDAAVLLSELATTTAAEVGETVTMLIDAPVGGDYVRRVDVASQIFVDANVDWWVGLDGVTRVGARPPIVAPADLKVLDWNPKTNTVSFSCSTIVQPGTVIVDARLGQRVVREVEADVANASVTGTLWVGLASAPVGALNEVCDGLAALARAATRAENGRFYEYRVVDVQADGRVNLQAVAPSDGVPDLLPSVIWPGVAGYKATLAASAHVLVGFRAGDPRQPFVAFVQPPDATSSATAVEIDALTTITLGDSTSPTARPVVRATDALAEWMAAVNLALATTPNTVLAVPPPLDIASQKVRAA